ncbi:MAG: hypothetical protein A2X22_07505 [Bacteroidetes bacterium GWF2_49_14]|nr:MAG: hypothetical protein A2X22_07505 [Bacteroidetes bacterium GWF2_49_14]HBB93729.1 hypothetical protein [Bacteroidales bacterium]
MIIAIAFIIITLSGIALITFLPVKAKGVVTLIVVLLNAAGSGYVAVESLMGKSLSVILPGSIITGTIPIRIDALSGWFILIINLVCVTGVWYGLFYMKAYKEQRKKITLHAIAIVLLHAALLGVVSFQNMIAFLIAWEVMMFSAFIGVIFEQEKEATIRAGVNYLMQSHFSVIFLIAGFLWVSYKTGSYDFTAITALSQSQTESGALFLFLLFFIGFAIKSGFVPFHTWLPYAHPAAPAHISGIMSGVLIKSGIYGILRMLMLMKLDYTGIGYFILIISVVSGLYGVMMAIVQHDLKKLLAYHSIENIGIIGIGIGIGCIGLGTDNPILAALGFAGALLHTLNHALFKSLLFYTAGIVYQSAHTLNIEHLGGLIKKMPKTSILFLIAAVAITGIPPFNGFISEFIIYNGLYQWLQNASLVSLLVILFLILGLVLIGGLALLCFTKAFGIVFLGQARKINIEEVKEPPSGQLLPLYLIAFFLFTIGLFPQVFLTMLAQPVRLLVEIPDLTANPFQGQAFDALRPITWAMWVLIGITSIVYLGKRILMRKQKAALYSTWGCGYVAPTPKMQYTASSYMRGYSKLNKPTLLFYKHEKEVDQIFPTEGHYESHAYDKIEKWLIDKPISGIKAFLGIFRFIQNGRLQSYLLYGVMFILLVIFIPMIYSGLDALFDFLKHL